MAVTILQIMQGIETRLETIPGLRVSDTVPGQINPPQAIVGVPNIPDYRRAFGPAGLFSIEPTITVLTSAAIDRVGEEGLAAYLDKTGPSSIFAAIEADKTLGLLGIDCNIKSFQRLDLQDVGLIGYWGGRFTLACLATG